MRRILLLISIFAVLPAFPAAAAEVDLRAENKHSVAVIIGNKRYSGRLPEVSFAHNDAAAVGRYVTEVLGYRKGNVMDLRDATKAQLEATFGTEKRPRGRLFNWVRAGRSNITVYYSGHGVPGLQDRRSYLLPVDGDPNLAEITGYPVELLYANLAKIDARSVTVLIEACFSGESPKGLLVRAASGITLVAKRPEGAAGLTVLTAAANDQLASWDEKAKLGLFTKHLLDALYGAADSSESGDADGRVTLVEVERYLEEEMSYAARRRFNRQQRATVLGNADRVLATVTPGMIAKSISLEEMQGNFTVKSGANVRRAPSTRPPKVAFLAKDAEVRVSGKVKGSNWYRVERHGRPLGFVFGELLETAVLQAPKPPPRSQAGRAGRSAPAVKPGQVFRDCDGCPEMVALGGGAFDMGTQAGMAAANAAAQGYAQAEQPAHRVAVPGFAIGRHEVTRAQYAAFVKASGRKARGCYVWSSAEWKQQRKRSWKSPGFAQGDDHPAVCVSWQDAQAYATWLSGKTGGSYRLPSEAEWEFTARAGGMGRPWGSQVGRQCRHANGADRDYAVKYPQDTLVNNACGDGHVNSAPVGGRQANALGLHDTLGNAWEWVADCWHPGYVGAPGDGGAWTSGGNCAERVLRGGLWAEGPDFLRPRLRLSQDATLRISHTGFRLVRELK